MSDKLIVKFCNPKTGEYLKETSPIVWTANEKDGLVKELEVGVLDYVEVKSKVLDIIEHCLTSVGVLVHVNFYNGSGEPIYLIELTKTLMGVHVTAKINGEVTISSETKELLDYVVAQVDSEIVDIYLRSMSSKTISKTVEEMKDALGMKSSSLSKEDDEAALCEKISKDTKAEVVKPKETLADYQCNNILKEELEEIKDFFENRNTYKDAGIELPKGILLKGPPGTGKTYAARCIAGSVDCYFMVCTASSLQGMYIGSGAENIRNVFKGAKLLAEKSKKGVIVFIDELDSFGSRNTHGGGAGGEEDRTINQLLAEMSGFEDETDIMVLAATNYPERLDDALQRSGRFGRQITINYPDDVEREALIKQYFGKLKLPIVGCDTTVISDLTKNMTPADIKEIANESGILTVRQKKSDITLNIINEAVNKVITKDTRHPDNKDILDTVTAHECGHVLAEVIYKGSVPVKVTNYAYGDAGGFTQSAKHLSGLVKKEDYLAEVKSLLAGRAAEDAIFGYITNGASSDLKKAKSLIRSYYEIYNFEPYEVKELEQLVINKLDSIYNEIVSDFREPKYNTILKNLIDELNKKRVLYTSDMSSIVGTVMPKIKF